MADERRPFHGKCAECAHIWVVLYLPMELARAAEVMGRATCPMCAATNVLVSNGGERGRPVADRGSLTAEQRYRQAMTKGRIKRQRAIRGSQVISGMDDRSIMIDALRLAYEAGLRRATND